MLHAILLSAGLLAPPGVAGPWRAVLDLAGGPLRFTLEVDSAGGGRLCNGSRCDALSAVRVAGDTVVFDIGDYDATITAWIAGDSLVGAYRNVGNRGPRRIPFRAARGTWPAEPAPETLAGRWDGWMVLDGRRPPRVLRIWNAPGGMEGTWLSATGDYGLFWGRAEADSFSLAHFDGSFVYMITGRLDGDTLRGLFHAGAGTQTPWVAVRSDGGPHLPEPTTLTTADSAPFAFRFPDLEGRIVTQDDPRFRGKVLVVDIFGSWCPTCHDAAPVLRELYETWHDRGLAMVGLAYEVTGDTAIDNRQVRRFRDKFDIPFPLLLAGQNETDLTAATLPQLSGFTSYPTTIFIGPDGRVRKIHAGFYGPAAGARYTRQVREFHETVERLLAEAEASGGG